MILERGEFLGRGRVVRESGGLLFYSTHHAPNARLPHHAHVSPYFLLVADGALTETCGHEARSCPPGTVIFNPAEVEHADAIARVGGQCFMMQLGPSWTSRYGDMLRGASWTTYQGLATWLAAQLKREAEGVEPASDLAIEGYALLLVAEVTKAAGRSTTLRMPPAWLRGAAERLRESFADPPSIAALALESGVHPVYFARTFREYFHCSPGDYLRAQRLEWARQALAGARSLCEIAVSAGYTDQAHFSRDFKRRVGLSPAAYRRASRSR